MLRSVLIMVSALLLSLTVMGNASAFTLEKTLQQSVIDFDQSFPEFDDSGDDTDSNIAEAFQFTDFSTLSVGKSLILRTHSSQKLNAFPIRGPPTSDLK